MPSIVVGDRTYPCTGTVTIGRKASCDIVLEPGPGALLWVCAVHAAIVIDATGAATFRDGSEDGSFVNDALVTNRAVPLQSGDRIRIGRHELVFLL